MTWIPELCGYELKPGLTIIHMRGHTKWVPNELARLVATAVDSGSWGLVLTLGAPRPKVDAPIVKNKELSLKAFDALLWNGKLEADKGQLPIIGLLGLGNIGKDGEEDNFTEYRIRTGKVGRHISRLAAEYGVIVVACSNPPYSWRCPEGIDCIPPKKLNQMKKEIRHGDN